MTSWREDTTVCQLKTRVFLGDMCGKLESVSAEVLSPVMSTSTSADEGETTEEPVVVVSCCGGG